MFHARLDLAYVATSDDRDALMELGGCCEGNWLLEAVRLKCRDGVTPPPRCFSICIAPTQRSHPLLEDNPSKGAANRLMK